MLVSCAVKLEGALNGGPVEKEIEPILQRIGQVVDLSGTTVAQVANFIQSSQDASLWSKEGGLRVILNRSASELNVVICLSDEPPNRLPTWSPALQEEAGNLQRSLYTALR